MKGRSLMTMLLRALPLITAMMLASAAAAQQATEAPPPYRPGLGDLMTTTVQPRHIKLAFAGREKNWAYAAYELRELEEAFDRLSLQWPQWQRVRIVELVETMIRDPLYELGLAIKDKSDTQYTAAYRKLTEACNACHQAARRPFVVIQEPKESMYPDQDFSAKP
jgi:hypothetical protein